MERVGLRLPRSLLNVLVLVYAHVPSLYVSEKPLVPKARFLRRHLLGSSVNRGIKRAGTYSSPGPSSGGGGSRTRVRERAVREILRA
jgi:hypothetical protein